MPASLRLTSLALMCATLLAACASSKPPAPVTTAPKLVPLDFSACRNLLHDDQPIESLHQAALRSGAYFSNASPPLLQAFDRQVDRSGLAAAVDAISSAVTSDSAANLICERFRVYRVELPTPLGMSRYGDMQVAARRTRNETFRYPVYEPPSDLVEVDLAQFCSSCDQQITQGRVSGSRVVRYHTRGEIAAGALDGGDYELGWLDDPLTNYLLQLRGSGTLEFTDGTHMYLGYASANGRTRTDIAQQLVKQGKLRPEAATLPGLRDYLRTHGEEGAALIAGDERQTFFTVEPVGPVGSLGVPITPERTIATDGHYPKGAIAFLRTVGANPMSRFVFIQDGGATMQTPDRIGLFAEGEPVNNPVVPAEIYLILPAN